MGSLRSGSLVPFKGLAPVSAVLILVCLVAPDCFRGVCAETHGKVTGALEQIEDTHASGVAQNSADAPHGALGRKLLQLSPGEPSMFAAVSFVSTW